MIVLCACLTRHETAARCPDMQPGAQPVKTHCCRSQSLAALLRHGHIWLILISSPGNHPLSSSHCGKDTQATTGTQACRAQTNATTNTATMTTPHAM